MDDGTGVEASTRSQGRVSMQREQEKIRQSWTGSSGGDQPPCAKQKIIKETSVHSTSSSGTVSTVNSDDYSSDSSDLQNYLHEVAHSPIRFSLSDARIALSYVQSKMKEQEKTSRPRANQCRATSILKHHQSSSRTYSSFCRLERSIMHHKMELLEGGDEKAFNIYTSNADFVERPLSISMIEDTPTAKVIPAKDDNFCHALRIRSCHAPVARSSKVMFPSRPPTRPPPLQLHRLAHKNNRRFSQDSKSVND